MVAAAAQQHEDVRTRKAEMDRIQLAIEFQRHDLL